MFKEMRRGDRELPIEEAKEILLNGEYGVLSMVGANDYGYGIPLSYVYDGKDIYFHCAVEGQKLVNLEKNNQVSFCVIGEVETLPAQFSVKYSSTIAFGKTTVLEGEAKFEGLMALVKRYSPDYVEKGRAYANADQAKTVVIKLEVEHVTGKRHD